MIFVTLGSQKFQFDRLLKELDKLKGQQIITQEIFAQIGYSEYEPQFIDSERFVDRQTFQNRMEKAELVITHGGTGAIITALKKEKKIIAVPRKKEFGEHVDNHQKQIVDSFSTSKYIIGVNDVRELEKAITQSNSFQFKKFVSNNKKFVETLISIINDTK
ncbi:hypothetical protein A5821_003161 [Enterococcus sp. 7F3_DIV0205]|uniref:Glycosyl transferase family 28 C-terminal domain-containing protein n=1 Tax=Candidatus Enterococcus palustris TaxID=1834189 RepID=A0AAQ3WB97_9ENTE|nr:PssE/Cps14G family polysaccharide biosynthesis glycosyltransferase [Enterococcus sp. 7F3_DIV0205]OTN83595.1 hypothetical protein A5821_003518 [Enterococcus sp. 7F3_DIV0205]